MIQQRMSKEETSRWKGGFLMKGHHEVSHLPVTEKETKPLLSHLQKTSFSSAHSPLHHTDTQTNHTDRQTENEQMHILNL